MRLICILLLICTIGFSQQTTYYPNKRVFTGELEINSNAVFDFKGTEVDSIIVNVDTIYFYVEGELFKGFKRESDPVYIEDSAYILQVNDTISLVATINYVNENISNYSVSLYSDLSDLSPSVNETAYVGETNKIYSWDGVSWNEISVSTTTTDNRISFSQSNVEEIIDYNQLDTMNYVASNYFNMANALPLTTWEILNKTNDDYLITGRKRTDITYQGGTNIHTGGTFSDYFLAFDDSMRVVESNTYGTDNNNNIHSMYQGYQDKIYRSILTQGSFLVNGTTYTTTSLGVVDGYIIIEDGDTYIADTVYPIFTGTGTTQVTVSDYDIYNDINYITGRTQGDTFIIHSQNGLNDTIIQTGSQSLCIIKYDINFNILDTLIMQVSNTTSQNTAIKVTNNYVYYLTLMSGDIVINDSTFTVSSSSGLLVKFNKDLEMIYVRTIQGTSSAYYNNAINIDENDNVRITFVTNSDYTIQYTDSTYSTGLTNNYGGTDAGEIIYNTNGDYVSHYQIGGTGNDLIISSIKNKDLSFVVGYSTSLTMTIGDSILNHGETSNDPFLIYLNNTTGNLISGKFEIIDAQAAYCKNIIKSENSDYYFGSILIDDPASGTITIGDSSYTSPGTGNQFTILFKWGVEEYKKGLALNHDKVFIGDYYNGKYVEYDTTMHAMTYYDPPSSFSGNQIPSMTAVQTEISEIDSSWNSININHLQSKDNDSIIVDSTIFFDDGIIIKTNIESFSASKTINYSNQHDVKYTITSNTVITVSNIPSGSNPQLSLIWSGGDYTCSISGATQMSGNSTISFQEVNGAIDLVQFKNINGTVYYSILNIVTP